MAGSKQGMKAEAARGMKVYLVNILTLKCRKATHHLACHHYCDGPGTVTVLGCRVSPARCGLALKETTF